MKTLVRKLNQICMRILMIYRTNLTTVFIAVCVLTAFGVWAEEIIIFDDELGFGNLYNEDRGGAMNQFEVWDDNPQLGEAHLGREFNAGEWAWINGIENMGIDLNNSKLDFDETFFHLFIDSGEQEVGYIELRLANQLWNVFDWQTTSVKTDNSEGYQEFEVKLEDFTKRGGAENPKNWKDFTAGGQLFDRISWGFGPQADLTLLIDSIRIADQRQTEMGGGGQAVDPLDKLAAVWGKLKAAPPNR